MNHSNQAEEQLIMKGNNMNKPVIHGEVILKPVGKLPEGELKKVKSYIVGHSETGHHHVLESPTDYSVIKDKFNKVWLMLETEAELVHQKTTDVHKAQTIAPGIYEVGAKTEYNPFEKVISRVRD